MIKQLAHVCIAASNLAITEPFYCGKFGLEKTPTSSRGGG